MQDGHCDVLSVYIEILSKHFVNRAKLLQIFFSMLISFLYMFRATMCPSSGEITASMRHLVFVTLCGLLSGMHIRNHPHRISSTMCRTNTDVSPDDVHMVA